MILRRPKMSARRPAGHHQGADREHVAADHPLQVGRRHVEFAPDGGHREVQREPVHLHDQHRDRARGDDEPVGARELRRFRRPSVAHEIHAGNDARTTAHLQDQGAGRRTPIGNATLTAFRRCADGLPSLAHEISALISFWMGISPFCAGDGAVEPVFRGRNCPQADVAAAHGYALFWGFLAAFGIVMVVVSWLMMKGKLGGDIRNRASPAGLG